MTPYNAFDNNPILWADPSGADSEKTASGYKYTGKDAQNVFAQLQKTLGGGGKSKNERGMEEAKRGFAEHSRGFDRAGASPIAKAGSYYSSMTSSFQNGVNDFVSDGMDFVQNNWNSESYWGGKVQSAWNGIVSLGVSASKNNRSLGDEMLSSAVQSISSMSLSDWSYAAGYNGSSMALSYGSGFIAKGAIGSLGALTRTLKSGYGVSAFGGRFQGLYLNPNAKGMTFFAIQNGKNFKSSTWHFRLDVHKVYSLGNRQTLHYHGGRKPTGMSNRQWHKKIEGSATSLMKF